MRYFKAFEIDIAPYMTWQLWANSIEELAEMGYFEDPLIVSEDNLPVKLFGVYVLKIVEGELVERSEEEMTSYDDANQIKKTIAFDRKKIEEFDTSSFGFGDNLFPMHETARLRYMAIAMDSTATDSKFLNVNGVAINILESQFTSFFNAYYKQIQLITNI